MDYCPTSQSLLEEVTTQDKLYFKSTKTGTVYEAGPENTMLASEETGEIHSVLKFQNALKVTAFDPTNPRMYNPCDKCHRQIVSYQRLGEEKKTVYVCVCGNRWS
jgi:DNA-directed RNA polymerase subunit M/transcription elongation factor TFIIS